MYGWLWRALPGRWPVKAGQCLALLLSVLALLFYVVFPYAEDRLPFNNVTVDKTGPAPTASSAPR